MNVGKRIRDRRVELGLSQRALASKMGYNHHSTLAKIELGQVDVTRSKLVKFADVLDTTVNYLMDLDTPNNGVAIKNDKEEKCFYNAIYESWKRGYSFPRLAVCMNVPECILLDKLFKRLPLTVREAKQFRAIIGEDLTLEYLFGEEDLPCIM